MLQRKGRVMFSKVASAAISGVDCVPVEVEADVSTGLPMFSMVGYLNSQVKEAQERVWTALRNTGFTFPARRITVNLSPADIRKEGTRFDLPIAAALLCAFGYMKQEAVQGVCMAGELSLNGEVKPVKGILPLAELAARKGYRLCIVPEENRKEAEVPGRISVLGIRSLKELEEYAGKKDWGVGEASKGKWEQGKKNRAEDFADIIGQEAAKRAAVIAAAGFHNLLLIGTKGSGKTMIASRIPGIFPEMTWEESMEVSRIYSAAGLLSEENPLVTSRPFRSPHHTISPQSMAGGGRYPRPGEITLAHRGILFLDELPEFSRRTLEILRQPLEERKICISRSAAVCTFPADFLLAAAMNPCPCGYYPDRNRCSCSEQEVHRYLRRISGPLLDRFDICTEVQDVPIEKILKKETGKTTEEIRREISRVHKIQRKRYGGTRIRFNSGIPVRNLEKYCPLSPGGKKLLKKAYEKMNLSMRAYHKILKTARTIADLEDRDEIQEEHVSEAVFLRAMDRKYWN